MQRLGLGIIGYGGIAAFHSSKLIKDPRLEIRGIYDINPERLVLAENNGFPACRTARELLDNPAIQIVLVATPNNFHHDYAVEAMTCGKHVICEKPVAMNSAELLDMIAVSKRTGKVLTVHQNRRRDPDFQMVRDAIAAGDIGKPHIIESRVQGSRGVPQGWRQYKVAGGGMLLDWGVHMIDQLLMLRPDKVVNVFAHLFSIKCPEIDDTFKMLMRFEDGLSAHIEVGTYNFITLPRWYACGDRGTLQIDDWNGKARVLRARESLVEWEEEIIYTKAGPTKTMAPRAKETIVEQPLAMPEADYSAFYSDLVDHIEGKMPLAVMPEEALRVMQVMEAAFQSQATGQAIKVSI